MRQRTVIVQNSGFGGLLFLLFLGLKLGGVINWSWWWVTSPLWGPVALALGIIALSGAVWGTIMLFARPRRGYKSRGGM